MRQSRFILGVYGRVCPRRRAVSGLGWVGSGFRAASRLLIGAAFDPQTRNLEHWLVERMADGVGPG